MSYQWPKIEAEDLAAKLKESLQMNAIKPRAVTLFSGIGSSSLALRNLGYEVIPHDIMPEAVETLKANGFTRAQHIDVREINYGAPLYHSIEFLVGGPPCQPFSQSHDGDGEYDPRDMIPEFVRAVRELLPKVFIMEEVKTLTWKKNLAYFKRVLADLEEPGYRVQWRVLDASTIGEDPVGQARKRLFVIGVREDVALEWERFDCEGISWPIPRPNNERPTMADFLDWDRAIAAERNLLAPKPGGDWSWVFRQPSTTVVGSFRPDVQAAPAYRKPGDGPRQNAPGSVVTTRAERLKLQGLPEDWVVIGSDAKQDLQIGNSCPTTLLQELIDFNIP